MRNEIQTVYVQNISGLDIHIAEHRGRNKCARSVLQEPNDMRAFHYLAFSVVLDRP